MVEGCVFLDVNELCGFFFFFFSSRSRGVKWKRERTGFRTPDGFFADYQRLDIRIPACWTAYVDEWRGV